MRLQQFSLIAAAVSLACGTSAIAQPRPRSGAEFPAAAFDSLDRIAFYLWQYDSFAWATSDKLAAEASTIGTEALKRLGDEWFCFKRDSTWHAVYGRFDEAADKYDAVVHYTSAGRGQIVRSMAFADTALGNRLGRALATTQHHLPAGLAQAGVRFNTYVREREDGGIDVWIVPAWQSNGWLAYGIEFQYMLDPAGRMVRDSVVRLGALERVRPDSTASVHLAHAAPGIPTVAEILFIRLYTKYFAHVRVFTRDWVTELFRVKGQQAWVHALREEKAPPSR
jgi:hypothetical protein